MKVSLNPTLSDAHLDANQASVQRQLSIAISAMTETQDQALPLNLCLVLDHSGSMKGNPLETVKQAALQLVDRLTPRDHLSVIAFDHRAKVIVPNQHLDNPELVKQAIMQLKAAGGTAIDEGMKFGLKETAKGQEDSVSQVFVLTDGENEHGDNERCIKIAQLASEYNITLNALGFGTHWNQDVLEKIADTASGTLSYIEQPEQAVKTFERLFTRVQAVGLTNGYLQVELNPNVRLAELKPIAQVAPDTVELPLTQEGNYYKVRLGDLMTDTERIILVNMYVSQLPLGTQTLAELQVQYDNPATGESGLLSEKIPVMAEVQEAYQPQPEEKVQKSVLALAKYRQTQIAETKLKQGDRAGAATMLQTAAKTALQMGDNNGATVLQDNATRLQSGEELSESDRKKTRIVSKTMLQE
jgi:Ca-activated chloride channel family protein